VIFSFESGKYDPNTCEFDSDKTTYLNGLKEFSARQARSGVTSYFTALATTPIDKMKKSLSQIAGYVKSPANGKDGAKLIGAFSEGTYVNPACAGAQNPELMLEHEIEKFDEINESGVIKLVAVAPDFGKKSFAFIRDLIRRGIIVSAGHCKCSGNDFHQAKEAGVKYIVHFMNGQIGSSYKSFDGGGIVEAVLMDDDTSVELILDGCHVSYAYVRDVIMRKTLDKVVAVTDSMFPAGDDSISKFSLSGMKGKKSDDGRVLIADNTKQLQLFGSVLSMDVVFSNLLSALSTPEAGVWYHTHPALHLDEAVLASTVLCATNPANLTGLKSGRIMEGAPADVVLAEIIGQAGDYRLNVKKTFTGGEPVT